MNEEEIMLYCEDILLSEEFEVTKYKKHHHMANYLYQHLVNSAVYSKRLCERFHLNDELTREIVRAALLHDFYDFNRLNKSIKKSWTLRQKIHRQYAIHHGKNAAKNAKRVFNINDRQFDAIERHMFPLSKIPNNVDGWIVTLADKMATAYDSKTRRELRGDKNGKKGEGI